ncbi:MAG: DUF1614 domain-containing protein [Planctomycetaceae bacterium]|nr:DUF1614 domain-containing protein [Planctomycetaceae bacterium]
MSFGPQPRIAGALPAIGCIGLFLALMLTCLMPLVMFNVMQSALERLHLSPVMATLLVMGIFIGSVVNFPVHRFTRPDPQPEVMLGPFGYVALGPQIRNLRRETVIAVNLGGCIIPCLIAVWQMPNLLQADSAVTGRLLAVSATNIAACYLAARPVAGVGIMMPGLLSPLVAVGMTWLLCPEAMEQRVSIAYVSGIAGPVIGADLLHLRDILKVPVGMLSIGGAGTFDGIVLSGILAALLA